MQKRSILVQIDTDTHPSVFDRVVAVDAGADEIFSYGGVTPEQVQSLVHGAIFTRGPADLKRTAFFIGGNDVAKAEALLAATKKHMIPSFGLQVSVMLDANGCNTTASAAVRSVQKHLQGPGHQALVLGGTGPVGQRAALLLALGGFSVKLASRQKTRSEAAAEAVKVLANGISTVSGIEVASEEQLRQALTGVQVVIAAGAAGVCLLPESVWKTFPDLKVLVDLNAVPPLGIGGVEVMDRGATRHQVIGYGALGVGSTKMKLHRKAVQQLFESNNQVLDAPQIHALELPG